MEKGIVKWFNDEKGYGFIERKSGSDIFVYWSNIKMQGHKTLEAGEKVKFDVEKADKGENAINVEVIEEEY